MAALDLPPAQQDDGNYQSTAPTQAAAQQPAPAPAQAAPAQAATPAVDTAPPQTPGQSTMDQLAAATKNQTPTSAIQTVAQSEPTPGANAAQDQPKSDAGDKAVDTSGQQPAQGGSTNTDGERPMVDPRPLKWLEQNAPDRFDMVMKASQEAGISPQRLAAHWYIESHFSLDPNVTSSAGAKGPVQLMPATAKQYNDGGKLDLNNPIDNLRIGARYMRHLDDQYGRDSVSSVAGYQGGEGSVNDAVKNPDMADRNHPNMMNYAKQMFTGFDVGSQNLNAGGSVDLQGAMKAAQNGPQGFLQYVANAAPSGSTMTDAWQHAEGSLVRSFLMRGDIAGAQHARDFVLQMSHAGSNQFLMEAYNRMNAGDKVGAAQSLAQAHSFFPDGTMGRFGIDKQGNVWGERLDENNPTRVLGQFKIDQQGIAGMLNQTSDPQQFLHTLQTQQQLAIQGRHQELLGQHYADMGQHYLDQANAANDRTALNAQRLDETSRHNAETERLTQELRTTQDARGGQNNAQNNAVDKEVSGLYGDAGTSDMANVNNATRMQLAQIYKNARVQGGADPVTAQHMAEGLANHQLHLIQGKDGNYAVAGKDGQPIGYLSKGVGDRIAGSNGPQPAPQQQAGVNTTVGAAPPTPGTTVNLSQSAAIPQAQS